MKKILIVLLILIVLPCKVSAAISFVDGKWETTFDCTEQTQGVDSPLSCDGIAWGGAWSGYDQSLITGGQNLWTASGTSNEWYYVGDVAELPDALTVDGDTRFGTGTIGSLSTDQYTYGDNDSIGSNKVYMYSTGDPDLLTSISIWIGHTTWEAGDYSTKIASAYNNPLGSGSGVRFYTGDGDNNGSGNMIVYFSAAEKEVWIRWYQRYELGFTWDAMNWDKSFYLYTSAGSFPFESRGLTPTSNYTILAQGVPGGEYQVSTDYGWVAVNGGQTGDGTFHCFEIYIKLDTDQTDGIGRIWINGTLRAEDTSVDWSNGSTGTQDGLTYITFTNNQAYPIGGTYYEDYDDLVIYNETPPGDCDGTPCIGQIPASTGGQPVSIGAGEPITIGAGESVTLY